MTLVKPPYNPEGADSLLEKRTIARVLNPERKFLLAYFQSPRYLLNPYRENMRSEQHLSGNISIKIDGQANVVHIYSGNVRFL